MDVVRIFNGLGNQMSQYAFYYAKKKAHPYSTTFITEKYASKPDAHNGYELEHLFGITSNKIKERTLHHILNAQYKPVVGYKLFERLSHTVNEAEDYHYDADVLKPSTKYGFTFYWGGWHSEKYFKHLRKELLNVFRFNEKLLNNATRNWAERIKSKSNCCSLHIRRGDFLKDRKWADAISATYYQDAINRIKAEINNVQFYVFSNDIEWCKEQFHTNQFHFIEHNNGLDAWQDMYLMSMCRHHINANSSFSWWGAWLSPYDEGITIVPERFISTHATPDIYPNNWIKIS